MLTLLRKLDRHARSRTLALLWEIPRGLSPMQKELSLLCVSRQNRNPAAGGRRRDRSRQNSCVINYLSLSRSPSFTFLRIYISISNVNSVVDSVYTPPALVYEYCDHYSRRICSLSILCSSSGIHYCKRIASLIIESYRITREPPYILCIVYIIITVHSEMGHPRNESLG